MIDSLRPVALAHLLAHQPRHHALDPLLADDGVLSFFEGDLVVVVDVVEGGGDGGLFGEEEGGFGHGHRTKGVPVLGRGGGWAVGLGGKGVSCSDLG